MKPRPQIILVGALLVGVAALSSMKRGARSVSAGQSCGTCCLSLPTPDGMRLPSVTNGFKVNGTSNLSSATNLTPSLKQN
jgi:hypothetical protein